MKLIKSPNQSRVFEGKTIFLAGSIDMGNAVNWQDQITDALHDENVTLFNPRRDVWDSSWKQDITNTKFREQVNWELDHLDDADIIVIYFDPNGKSPITLLELGLHASSGKCIVACPDGFWRKGNVQIVCNRFDIPLYDDLDQLIQAIKEQL